MVDEGGEAPKGEVPEPVVGSTPKKEPSSATRGWMKFTPQRFHIKDSGESRKFIEEELRKTKEGADSREIPEAGVPDLPEILEPSQWRRNALAKGRTPSDPGKTGK